MFYTGFKQIVLNEDRDIKSSVSSLDIPGFCNLDNGYGPKVYGVEVAPVDGSGGEWEVMSFDVDAACKSASITVKVHFSSTAGGGKDSGSAKIEQTFVSLPIKISDTDRGVRQTDINRAIIKGWERHKRTFEGSEFLIDTITASGDKLTITTNVENSNLMLTGVSYKTDGTSITSRAWITTPPAPPIGMGYLIEAEQQLSTFENRNPYKIDNGGGDPVLVDEKYTTYVIMTSRDEVDMLPHEALGYGDANTDTKYGYRGYVINVLDSATEVKKKIAAFVRPLNPLPIS